MTATTRIPVAGLIVALVAAVLAGPPAAGASEVLVDVIVRGASATHASSAVVHAGGSVVQALPVIGGAAARVPSDTLDDLAGAGLTVTSNAPVQMHGAPATTRAPGSSGPATDDSDAFSVRSAIEVVGADGYWARGATGSGIGVALIDTGVAPVPGLDNPGQVWHGPDLSFESIDEATRHLDTFGHGTHMAGLIAGRDPGASTATFDTDSDGFLGIAPDAHVVSLKVADHTGTADVSQVIAAIDWVVAHRNDPGLNIRVLNLSFGTYSGNDHTVDPIAHAAEVAWDHGIVVVAAAGNQGNVRTGLTSPAYSPRLLAVGAVDTNSSTQYAHWTPLSFSARGDGRRNPDILAPGASLASLRVPGSFLDVAHGETATVAGRYFKGTGTSQAAALVSGAAALVLSANPSWSPDMVKEAILGRSSTLRAAAGFTGETGRRALRLDTMHSARPSGAPQAFPAAVGGGSLQRSRGEAVVELDGVPLTGEQDIFGMPLDTVALAEAERSLTAWDGGTWNGTQWSGTQWSGTQWSGTQWSGSTWSGTQWSGTQWSGTQWSGTQWSGGQWSGTQWSGGQWSGNQWSGGQWSGTQWAMEEWS